MSKELKSFARRVKIKKEIAELMGCPNCDSKKLKMYFFKAWTNLDIDDAGILKLTSIQTDGDMEALFCRECGFEIGFQTWDKWIKEAAKSI